MGYGSRIKEALLGLDERYANAIRGYKVNPNSPSWVASNIPDQSAQSIRTLQGYAADGFENFGERMEYGRDFLGAVGTRYLVPVTAAGLSLEGLTRVLSSDEEY